MRSLTRSTTRFSAPSEDCPATGRAAIASNVATEPASEPAIRRPANQELPGAGPRLR